jgi:hypothetical protein
LPLVGCSVVNRHAGQNAGELGRCERLVERAPATRLLSEREHDQTASKSYFYNKKKLRSN